MVSNFLQKLGMKVNAVHIRKLKKEEIDLSISMSEFAFQLDLSEDDWTNRRNAMNPDDTLVVDEDGTIISKLTTLPLTTYINGKKFAMGGVSGVATWPEHRRNGLVKALLKKGLVEMKEKRQSISFLFPFSIPFYRKYGWELFCDKKVVTLTKEQLPSIKNSTGSVRRIGKEFDILDPIYQCFASQYNGMLVRDKAWWDIRIFKQVKGHIAVYTNNNGENEGYIIYEVKQNKMKIQELIYLTNDAWRSLWNFISNHDSMLDSVELTIYPNDPSMFFLNDPRVEQKLEAYFMARIVDVKQFLTDYSFQLETSETLVFHVEDSFCEWNNGSFFVKGTDKEQNDVQVFQEIKDGAKCAHPPKRGISCSIQHLTAMLMNYQKPSSLLLFDAIKGSDAEVARLENAVPLRATAFFDFF